MQPICCNQGADVSCNQGRECPLAALYRIANAANRLALDALDQYNAETAGGGEPPFPQWAFDIALDFKKATK